MDNRGKVADEFITSVFGHSAAYEQCCVLCSLKEGKQDTRVYIVGLEKALYSQLKLIKWPTWDTSTRYGLAPIHVSQTRARVDVI
jgi:hypothetical protein